MITRARRKKVLASKTVRRGRKAKADRRDGYRNELRGHGTARDPRSYTSFSADWIGDLEAIERMRSSDIEARICELLPREATRRGFDLRVGGEKNGKQIAEDVMAEVERLDGLEKFRIGLTWERALGGSALFPVLEGAVGELHEDLSDYETGITRIAALHVLEPRELRPASWYTDLSHPKFRQPETYWLWPLAGGANIASGITEVIHESRLIIFPGRRVSNQHQAGQRPGWGDSILMLCKQVCEDYGIAWGSVSAILADFAQGVIKFDGLEAIMLAKDPSVELQKRATAMDMLRSAMRSIVIGKNDEFSRTTTPVSGMEGLIVQMAQRVAAAADMPLTILMGMSPAGMNATGEMDIRAWYDRVAGLQARITHPVEKLLRLIMLQTEGPTEGQELESYSVEWKPLWQPSEKETAETRKTVAETDAIYEGMSATTPAKIAKARWGGDTYSPEMHMDADELDAQAEMEMNPDDMSPEDLAAIGAAPAAPVAATPDIQKQAMNGAQIASLLSVIGQVNTETISRDQGVEVIMLAFQVDEKEAEKILGKPGWKPTPKEVPAALAAFAAPVGAKPVAPVADDKAPAAPPFPPKAKEPPAEVPAEK